MNNTEKRDTVLNRYSGDGWDYPDHEAMAWRIVELEAALDRLRAAAKDSAEQFVSHRAGYGDDKMERLIAYLRLHPTATLASGEGGMLVQHILLLRARIAGMSGAAKDYEDHYADARAEINRLRRILAALREPSEGVVEAASRYVTWTDEDFIESAIRTAVAAAEQEVGG